MTESEKGKLLIPDWFDERCAWEAEQKGWIEGFAFIDTQGRTHALVIYDPVRLGQDIEGDEDEPWFADKGLIVVQSVRLDLIERAVYTLAEKGYFDS